MKPFFTVILVLQSIFLFSQETLNTMFYNVFRFPAALPQNRELILKDILEEYQPDLLMICELMTEEASDLILNTSFTYQTEPFARAPFRPDNSQSSSQMQNMVYYNSNKFILESDEVLETVYRNINQYTFVLNLDYEEPVYLEVFIAHLKSSTGPANRQMRYDMVSVVTDKLEELNRPNTYVLFAGDFNFYNANNEIAYHKIISTENAIQMLDPIDAPGYWQDNPDFTFTHTQSTRLSNAGFGGGANSGGSGGLDDRFDYIMMSENFNTTDLVSYVSGTYKAYGNNANCLNKSINDESCSGEFSAELRENLYWMSDHTPVVMQFQTQHAFLNETSFIKNKSLIWFTSSNKHHEFIKLGWDANLPTDNATLEIYNSLGQLLQSQKMNNNSNQTTLDISYFASGIYFIKSTISNEVLRFIKE